MMDRVEEEPEEHVAQRAFPRHFSVHEEPGLVVPFRVVQARETAFQVLGVPLIHCNGFRDTRGRPRYETHFAAVDELARVSEFAREEPYQIPGGGRARMWAVVWLVRRHRLHHADEPRFFALETFLVILAHRFHGSPPGAHHHASILGWRSTLPMASGPE